jgi:hypothetical protein
MDIGTIIETGVREIPAYKPAPTMVPVTPNPESEPIRTPAKERELEQAE